jgi:hypothetical protein
MQRETLYQRLLGAEFERLHPILRHFHASTSGGRGTGVFRITRSSEWLPNLVADLMQLPPAADAAPVRLRVRPCGRTEQWLRSFNGRPLRSVQSEQDGLLIETAGPICFGFAVGVPMGGMTFQTRRVWLFGLPLPLAWAPAVEATVTPDDAGWSVSVALCVPILGQLVHYGGHLTPQ